MTRRLLDRRVWAALVALSVLRLGAPLPEAGWDPGWITALNLAADERLRFGHDLAFTYGPWGFLDQPLALSRPLLVFALLVNVVIRVALFLVLTARQPDSLTIRLCIQTAALILSAQVVLGGGVGIQAVLLGFVLAIAWIRAAHTVDSATWPFALAIGTLGGAFVTVKFSEGVAILAVGGLASLCTGRLRICALNATIFTGASVATFVLAWILGGQRISDVPRWLGDTAEIVSGYSEAMTANYGRGHVHVALAFGVAATLGSVTLGIRTRSRHTWVAFAAVFAAGTWILFRASFIRNDEIHESFYFFVMGGLGLFLLTLALTESVGRVVLACVVAGVSLAMVPWDGTLTTGKALAGGPSQLMAFLRGSDAHSAMVRSRRDALRRQYGLSPGVVSALQGHRVHVDAWEVSLTWAYGLSWGPAPTIQNFMAYTEYLDRRNADWLEHAPPGQRILLARTHTLDGRNGIWDTPAYRMVLACNFDVVAEDRGWQVLARRNGTCGAEVDVESVRVVAQQQVTVPAPRPRSLLVASFTSDAESLAARTKALLYRPTGSLVVDVDQRSTYRLPRGLSQGPLLLGGLGAPRLFGGDVAASTVAFSHSGVLRFSCVPLAPQACDV